MKQPNFLISEGEAQPDINESELVILPAPYEFTTSYGQGADKGPLAILEASQYVEYYDEELKIETIRHLDVATDQSLNFTGLGETEALDRIQNRVVELLDSNKFVVCLGGEHTSTLPVFKAMNERFNNLSVLQIDAHSDLRESYEGNPLSHACVMARINELGPKIAQLGIRALSIEEAREIESNDRIETAFALDVARGDNYQDRLLNHLSDNVYITIDADGFDPSIIPGTGTPEPGGLEWYPTLEFLKRVFMEKNVVGFDVVECSPKEDEAISQFNLAKLVYKLIGYRYLKIISTEN